MMDVEALISAIDSQLDSLQGVVTVALGLAFVAAWAGWNGSKTVTVLSMELGRREAFWLIVATFLVLDVAVGVILWRLGEFVYLAANTAAAPQEALTVLATHAWEFNPFAYHGDSLITVFLDGIGPVVLFVAWWACVCSIFVVRPIKERNNPWAWTSVLVVIGTLTAFPAWYGACAVGDLVAGRAAECRPVAWFPMAEHSFKEYSTEDWVALWSDYPSLLWWRLLIGNILGVAIEVGMLLFVIGWVKDSREKSTPKSKASRDS